MATETLNVNVINATWAGASGASTDIDEAIAGADGSLYGPGAESDAADFGLSASGVVDADTVTNVSITVRLKAGGTAGDEQADVQLLIGGSPVGSAVSTGNLTGSFANYSGLNDAGWNSDWTAAQMDGAEVRITPTQSGMPGTNAVDLDCLDVVVAYDAFVAFTPSALSETELLDQNSFAGPFEI